MVSTLNLNRVEDRINELTNRIVTLENDYYGPEEESEEEPEEESEEEAEEDAIKEE
jgi:hypothetical protein